MSTIRAVDRFRPRRETVLWGALLLNVELLALAVYVLFADATITDPLIAVYPLVWINAGLLAVASTSPAPSPDRTRWLGIAVGAGYFALLAYVGGIVNPGHALHGHAHATGLRVAWELPPGWGPAILYNGGLVRLVLEPYKVVGYLALSYLVYATVLDAAGSALTGIVGLFSCVSCTWPVLGTVVTGVFGGGSAVAAFATNQPYGASTLVFLSAVALLYWRPVR